MASERLDVILQLITGNYKREAREAATATGQIGASAQTASGQVGIFGRNTETVGKKLSGLATGALLAGGAALIRFGADSIKAASTLEESMNAVKVVFGEASDTIVAFGEQSAEAAGLAQSEFQQMASVLGSALINAGMPLDEAAEKTIELTQRAADMASVFNTTVPDALGAMQAALRGESDPIEKYGVSLSAAAVDAEAAALGFKKVSGQFDAQAKAAARLSLIMRQTDRVAGDFANTSDGLANTSKILSARFTDLQADIGKGLIPIVLDAIDALEPLLDVFGFLADKLNEIDVAVEEGREAPSRWAQTWAIAADVGKGAIFGMFGVISALMDEENALRDNTEVVTSEIHDSWMNVPPSVFAVEEAIQDLGTAHQNAAIAASNQRKALINLFNAAADLLDPVRSVLLLQQESVEANKRLAEAQADSKTSTEDLALAVIEAEQAELRLDAAGAALTGDQIQAFSQLLVREFGYSEAAALDLLNQLGLLDGFEANVSVVFDVMNGSLLNAISTLGGSGINNTDIQVRAGGGPFSAGPMLVGEDGPEVLFPSQGGSILSNSQMIKALSGRGGAVFNINHPNTANLVQDMQLITVMASVTNLVEGL